MAASTKNILIFGSTGLIGESITNAIIANKKSFEKIVIFTSQNTVSTKVDQINQLKGNGAVIIVGDINSEADVSRAYNGIDTVVSCVGRPVIHHQLQLIQWADAHPDVKRFFPSEYGTDIEYGPESANEIPHQQKLKVRALLKSVQNIEYTYVVTGPYADAGNSMFLDARRPEDEAEGTFDVHRKRAVLLGDGDGKISMTTMKDVGKFVVGALLHPDAVRNRAIRVNSFTATPHEIVAEFEKQTGGSKWSVSYTSLAELKNIEKQLLADESPRVAGTILRRIWTSGGTLYDQRDNHLIGMENKVDNLEDAIRRAIQTQERNGPKH